MSLTSYQAAPPRVLWILLCRACRRRQIKSAMNAQKRRQSVFVTAATEKILVGTASWSDPGFVERWYPKRMPAGERLAWYAGHFEMVEVNSTFYSVPDSKLVERWCRTTPATFTFNVKLHK